jgi:hypothetical protein
MYRQTTTALALALAVASLSTSACLAERGDACAVDSDCAQGFACSPDNICVDFAGLLASFTLNKPTPPKDTTVTPEVVADVASDSDGGPTCRAPRGIFDATPGGPCLEPDEKLKVTRICIAPSGHGTQGLAFVGNAILSDQFDNDTVIVEAWIDGDLTPTAARSTSGGSAPPRTVRPTAPSSTATRSPSRWSRSSSCSCSSPSSTRPPAS